MQENYVHALPKVNIRGKPQSRRLALIFRQGEKLRTNWDNGAKATSLAGIVQLTPEQRYPYGSYRAFITEGEVYKRTYLLDSHAFGSIQGGVSGTQSWGCNAIVVSRQDKALFEWDSLEELSYSANRRQGGGRMFTSFRQGNQIRVFRTSALEGPYRARQHHDVTTQMYRYDGLYYIKKCGLMNSDGELVSQDKPPEGEVMYTFFLVRHLVMKDFNSMSLAELKCVIEGPEDPDAQFPARPEVVPGTKQLTKQSVRKRLRVDPSNL
jgi:SAD/SRA domain